MTRFQLAGEFEEDLCSEDPWLVLHKIDSPTKMRYVGGRLANCTAPADPWVLPQSIEGYFPEATRAEWAQQRQAYWAARGREPPEIARKPKKAAEGEGEGGDAGAAGGAAAAAGAGGGSVVSTLTGSFGDALRAAAARAAEQQAQRLAQQQGQAQPQVQQQEQQAQQAQQQ